MEARLCFRNIPVFVSRRAAGRRASISGAKRIPTVPCRPDGCHSCPAPRGLCCAEPAEPERADDKSGPARDVRFLPVRNREDTTIPSATGSIITDRVRLCSRATLPRAALTRGKQALKCARIPTAEWIARQLTEACGWDEALRYLIRGRRNQERPGANLVPSRASDASRYPIGLMAYASGARALCRKFFESDDRPVHFVQVRPASQAEWDPWTTPRSRASAAPRSVPGRS